MPQLLGGRPVAQDQGRDRPVVVGAFERLRDRVEVPPADVDTTRWLLQQVTRPGGAVVVGRHQDGAIRLVGDPLTHEEYGIACRKEDLDLKSAFDQGIAALRESGELRALEQKWGFVE